MNFRKHLLLGTVATAMAMPVYTIPASAQIDELIVTARKREENLQDVPISVTAFNAASIEQRNYFGVEEIARDVPGFEFDRSFQRSFERPIIRGKSNVLGDVGTSFFINGAFFDGTISSIDLSEVERIEVIKGPQSALFGRATYAGAINIITKQPGDEWQFRFSGTVAQDDQYEVSAGVSGPLIEGLLYGGVYVRHYEYGGDEDWVSIVDGTQLGEEESDSISVNLRLEPAEGWDFTFRGVYDERDDGPFAINHHDRSLNNFAARTDGEFDYFEGDLTEQAFTNNLAVARLFGKPGDREEHFGLFLEGNWEINEAFTLTATTSYDEFSGDQVDASPAEPNAGGFWFAFPGGPPLTLDSFSVVPAVQFGNTVVGFGAKTMSYNADLRVAYDDGGRLRGQVGFDFYRSRSSSVGLPIDYGAIAAAITPDQAAVIAASFQQAANIEAATVCSAIPGCDASTGNATLFGTPASIIGSIANDDGLRLTSITRNWAFYGQVEYDILSYLTATAEVRYANEEKRSIRFDDVMVTSPDQSLDETFTSVTPRFTLTWDISDSNNVYFNAANGTKPGGFNGGDIAAENGLTSFDEEEIWSFEIGTKNRFFDEQLQVNLAGFYEKISGYQLTQSIVNMTPEPGETLTSTAITNKGKVKVKGFEIDTVFAPNAIEGLTLRASYSYINAEFTEGTDQTEGRLLDVIDDGVENCSTGLQDPMAGCSTANVVFGSIVGRRTPLTAQHQFTGGFDYQRPLMGDWDWFAGATVSYNSDKFVQVQNLAIIPAATNLDANIGIAGEFFRLTFWGKNLTDEDAVLSGTRFFEFDEFFQRAFETFPRRGRQFGGTLTANF